MFVVVAEASVIDTLYTRSVFELNCNHRQGFLPVHVYLVLVFSFTFLRYFRYVMWPDQRRIHISVTSFLFHLHAGEAGEVMCKDFFKVRALLSAGLLIWQSRVRDPPEAVIFLIVSRVPLHTALHYHPLIGLI